jgi:DHA1 family quinolone resistance protein-like MFS transporter
MQQQIANPTCSSYSVDTMTGRKLLTLYSIHQSLHWFATGLLVPVMALLQLEKGLDLFQIGLTVAVYSATVMALELPTGGLADSIGRKRVYLYSLVAKTIAVTVVLFAQTFLLVLFGFLALGIARALSSGTMDAWFVDEFNRVEPDGNLQRALAIVGVFIPMGLGIGSIFGGILPDTLGRVLEQNRYLDLYSSNMLAMALIVIFQMLFTLLVIKDHHARETDGVSGFRKLPHILAASITYGVRNRIVLMLLVSTAALGFALSGLENFWQPQLKGILGGKFQTWLFGVLSAGYFLSASVGNLIVTPICRLFRNRYSTILFFSRIGMGVVWFVLALQTTMQGFAVFYIVVFLFNGVSTSPHAAIMNREIPSMKRSTLLSFESLVLQTGVVVGSVFMGYISKVQSISIAWYIGSVILLISSVFYLLIPKTSNPPSPEE